MMPENITALDRVADLKLLLLDCDGVMTDGRLYFGAGGEELKVFDVQDGQGIVAWIAAGNQAAIISGRDSEIVALRARELGIGTVRQGVKNKLVTAEEICRELSVGLDQSAFIGDGHSRYRTYRRRCFRGCGGERGR